MPQLIWDGKFLENGQRAPIAKLALPFQTIETVNEDTGARERSLNLFAEGGEAEWRNRLIWGDKKWVLPSLLPEFGGQVDLIYIDPPFDTGADFSFTAHLPDDPNTPGDQSQAFTKEPSLLELKAYRDIWGGAQTHLDAYLKWFYETVAILYDLLAPTGSIYVHLDIRMAPYAKVLLDEVFGHENFQNEIIWRRKGGSALGTMGRLSTSTDTILWFTKSENYTFNVQYEMPSDEYIEHNFSKVDKDGRRFQATVMRSPSPRPNLMYDYKGYKTPPNGWSVPLETMKKMDETGYLYFPKEKTKQIYKKLYLDEYKGQPLNNLWTDISTLKGSNVEIVGYPTQKPEALLERIIKASSNAGDLVLDSFCGSGTTAAVSEKLGRRWITCDLGRFAIHTARKRLLNIADLKPFQVQNLGKYERQAWRQSTIDEPNALAEHQKLLAYRRFILSLYHARPLDGYVWLHGVKNGRFVHVGSIDSPVSEGDITQIALEWKKATGGAGENLEAPTTNGIDVLGWEFAFELNDIKKQQAERANISLALKRIPREVMEKRAADSGEIQFFELAALELEHNLEGSEIALGLKNFIAPLDYLPSDVQSQITNWEQFVDYWAIDWDCQGDAFHNQWQSYRTKAHPKLEKIARFKYEEPGKKRVVVKVIDILGNDTTKMVEVEV